MCAKKVIEPSEIIDSKHRSTKRTLHPSINPWYRFLARVLDYALFIVVLTILDKIFGILPFLDPRDKYSYLGFVVFAAWIPIEAFFISKWGKTFGKGLLNIQLKAEAHHRLDYSRALRRSLFVWIRGFGMGLYMIAPFTMMYAFSQLKIGRQMSWDLHTHIVTTQNFVEKWRLITACVLLSACIIWFILI